MSQIEIIGLKGIPLVKEGDEISKLIIDALKKKKK